MTDDVNGDLQRDGQGGEFDGADAWVAEVLAGSPEAATPVPPAIAARWDAALEAEAAARAAGAAPDLAPVDPTSTDDLLAGFAAVAAPAATSTPTQTEATSATVIPLQRDRGARTSGWSLRLAGAAAAVAAIALVGGVVANQLATPSGDGVIVEASGSLPVADGVTRSNRAYTPVGLTTQVNRLIDAPPMAYADAPEMAAAAGSPASAAPTSLPTSEAGGTPVDGPNPNSAQDGVPGAGAAADPAAFDTFASDGQVREGCITNLAGAPGVKAVAMDVGFYNGLPSVLVVLPTATNPDTVDVFIVGPACDLVDADLRYFARIDIER
jgi:hypothetical protein